MKRSQVIWAMALGVLILGSVPATALAEFPAGCSGLGGYTMGVFTTRDDGSVTAARIGEQVIAHFVVRPRAGSCAIEGGQIAALDPAGNFVEMAGFDDTPSLPLLYFLDGEIFPAAEGFVAATPPMAVRCADVTLSPSGLPQIQGLIGFGTTLGGVSLAPTSYYLTSPPLSGGPSGLFGWAADVDLSSYITACRKGGPRLIRSTGAVY